jgi:hypothetical protein
MPLDQVIHARDSSIEVQTKIIEELLASEIAYYDCLKTVLHTYAHPLRKWGLTGQDHDILFGGLERLLQVVDSFIGQVFGLVFPCGLCMLIPWAARHHLTNCRDSLTIELRYSFSWGFPHVGQPGT